MDGWRAFRGTDCALAVGATADQLEKPRPHALEEVLVTAQKREQPLQDVPISIVALTAEELEARKITNIDNLAMAVPGMSIQSSGGFQRRIELRGISNTSGSSPLVGLYLDEADVTGFALGTNSQLDLQVYDLERVEVLRGPQGTLYGSGSAGGTIRFITKDPKLDKFAFNTDMTAFFKRNGEPSQRVEAMLNIPLVEDRLGLRMSGTYEQGGGWIDQPAADREDYNDQKLSDLRIKGLWKPTERLSAGVMALIHRNDGPNNAREDDVGNFTQVFNLTTTPSARDDYDVYNVTLSYDLPVVRIIGTMSYIEQDKNSSNVSAVVPLAPPPTDFILHSYQPDQLIYNETLNGELRFTYSGQGPWQWTLGGSYSDTESDFSALGQSAGFPGPPGTPLPAPLWFASRDQSRSSAIFGDASYEVTDRLTLGAGVRYFEDERESSSGFAFDGPAPLGPENTGKFDSVNPRIYATYKVAEDVNVYATAAKGFRSGGFNAAPTIPTFGPEDVWTYELGVKALSARRLVSAEAAIFYSEYDDYQIVGQIPSDPAVGSVTTNAGTAEIMGIEWGLSWSPSDRWLLGLNGHYVSSEFVEINVTSSTFAVGDQLDFFPEYAYTFSVQRDFTLSDKPGFARLDYNERGRSTFRDRTIGPFFHDESDVINMLNLNIGVDWNENLSFGLFGLNLLDDRGLTDPLDILGLASRSRPRTLGVEVQLEF